MPAATFLECQSKKSSIKRLATAGILIIFGAGIYIISRQDIIFFYWIPNTVFEAFDGLTLNKESPLGYFVVFCLPDGSWYGALLLSQSVFVRKIFISRVIFLFSIILPFMWELLQINSYIPGTFDPLDLLAYLLTLIIFTLFSIRKS